jgi:hypothetical protein
VLYLLLRSIVRDRRLGIADFAHHKENQ